jgi:hypothetical protein
VPPTHYGLAAADMRLLEVPDIIDVATDGTRMLEMMGMINDDRSISWLSHWRHRLIYQEFLLHK